MRRASGSSTARRAPCTSIRRPALTWPRPTIEAVRLRHLIEFRGTEQSPVRFVSFKGLTFRHAARTFMDNKEPLRAQRLDHVPRRRGLSATAREDCSLEDCFIDQVGGNAVFVNNYNRRVTVRGCHIARAGANGVAFVGDRDAARVPRDWNDHSQSLGETRPHARPEDRQLSRATAWWTTA